MDDARLAMIEKPNDNRDMDALDVVADLIAALRRQADIAASTDRAAVLAEAADRLEALAADGERLDWLGSTRARVEPQDLMRGPPEWIVLRRGWTWWFTGGTVRDAIDRAKENADS